MLDFLLGLPYLRDGLLGQTARRLQAPVLVSANALSRWRRDDFGLRVWSGFDRRTLRLVGRHPVALDSGGFVASVLNLQRLAIIGAHARKQSKLLLEFSDNEPNLLLTLGATVLAIITSCSPTETCAHNPCQRAL